MNEPDGVSWTALIVCPVCGRQVPDGSFCGACGTHLTAQWGGGAHRHQAYAADPDQHVLYPSVITTLFPHIPHGRMLPYQLAMGLAAVLLVALALLRWTGPSLALAALAVPILYLLYLYEVEVYEEEPLPVIACTVVLGAALGAVWSYVSGPVLTRITTEDSILGLTLPRLIEGAVLIPLAGQVLMLAGTLVLFARGGHDEALDGFSFGAAGALGYTAAATLVNVLPSLRDGPISHLAAGESAMELVQRGLCAPLLNAGLTGLIGAALWLQRGATRRLRHHQIRVGLGTVLGGTLAVRLLLGLEAVAFPDTLSGLAANAAAVVLVLAWVRVVVHHMLLAEAVEVPIGPEFPCTHCHHLVPRMAFCPNCGIATRATPKTGSGRAHRTVR